MDYINKVKEEVKSEPGTLTYRSLVDRKNNQVIMFEEYENTEAIEAHNKGQAFNMMMAKGGELFSKDPLLLVLEEF